MVFSGVLIGFGKAFRIRDLDSFWVQRSVLRVLYPVVLRHRRIMSELESKPVGAPNSRLRMPMDPILITGCEFDC